MSVLDGTYKGEGAQIRRRVKKSFKRVCSKKTVKRKLPILQWLPTYTFGALIQDIIAGITVGLTAIPQGIANALIAGLSPEYGLNAGLLGGVVYVFVGSCKDITVGPTAIIGAMISKYVDYSADFAVLATFLAGVVEFLMGALNFGFLVEFISVPVISGFTTAAALQIAASQLKSLFGLAGSSGNFFAQSVVNFFKNIKTSRLWDPVLGFGTIFSLMLLKRLGQGCSITGGISQKIRWYLSLSRNAVVVIIGMLIAFIIKQAIGEEPMILVGNITRGLPTPSLPPFSTTVGNETYNFIDMLQVFGPGSLVIPLVSTLEAVAIAKAFSGGLQVDSNQEMMALGLCNIASSFVSSMPITGSFTKTALNHASGVRTPAGGIGLEYGIVTGVLLDAAVVLFYKARPKIDSYVFKTTKSDMSVVTLKYSLSYCASEYVRQKLLKAVRNMPPGSYLIVDGTNLQNIDLTIAANLMSVAGDIDKRACPILFLNFDESIKKMCIDLKPQFAKNFVISTDIGEAVDVYLKNM
ncbi:unnamed protein product [Leptosia nina]|uniref:STAS domain-containing protein n=1 Tax=Leptosia nina TaxID=320188 RepID=A0AAV1JW35_9NEOP